jgi:cytochrome c553
MQSRSVVITGSILLAVILVVAGCGGSKATTSTPVTTPVNTVTTTTAASSTTTTAASTTPTTAATTTSAAGKAMDAVAMKLEPATHPAAYDTLCLMCHGAGMANQYPTTPSWDGSKAASTSHPGTWTVAAGSPADHTGRTDVSVCLTQAGCHTH